MVKLIWLRITCRDIVIDKSFGKSLAKVCESAGGAFLKIGQILSTRYDLFTEETIFPLQRLQDNVCPFDSTKIPKIFETNFQRKFEEIFAEFDFQPIGSASIAQVHYARLKEDNTEVAVKILRPKIKTKNQDDLFLINFVVKHMKKLSWFNQIPLEEATKQISDCLLQQTDFIREAQNNRKFQDAFFYHPLTKIPRLRDEFCTDEILTMEYFGELKKVTHSSLNLNERKKIVVECLQALYRMIFVEGVVHCDLHPSNFFRHGHNCLIILDTGFVAVIDAKDQTAFRDFFMSVVFNDASTCARIISETALSRHENFNQFDFEKEIRELLVTNSCVSAEKFQVSKFVLSLFEIQRKHRLYSTPNFTLPILSLLVYEGTTRKYFPNLDFQRIAVPFLSASLVKSL